MMVLETVAVLSGEHVMELSTPAGRPASWRTELTAHQPRGLSSEPLKTTVFPAAIAKQMARKPRAYGASLKNSRLRLRLVNGTSDLPWCHCEYHAVGLLDNESPRGRILKTRNTPGDPGHLARAVQNAPLCQGDIQSRPNVVLPGLVLHIVLQLLSPIVQDAGSLDENIAAAVEGYLVP